MSLQSLVQEVQVAAEEVSSNQKQGHSHLLHAIHKLNLAVETPAETLTRTLYQLVQNSTLRMAVEIGLFKPIAARCGKPISANELAEETKSDSILLVRLLRALSAMGLCDEVGYEIYQANAVTEALATPGWDGGVKFVSDTLTPVLPRLKNLMRETEFRNPEGRSSFERTFGTTLWGYLSQEPYLQKSMMDYMKARRTGAVRWTDIYPLQQQMGDVTDSSDDDVLLVDVGGNQGHDLKMFRDQNPNSSGRLVLMDLPEAIENNKSDMTGIEMIAYDFFTPQPVIGARFYFFRAICHDWSDEKCKQFLTNTVKAMKRGHSKLLINDFVLPDTGCALHPALMDNMMMHLCGGCERTKKHWTRLLDSIGLEIIKIWSHPGTEAVIETQLKREM